MTEGTDMAAGPAARRGGGPAMLALALYVMVLAAFATFPVLDRLMRDAGRPDLALLGPFVVASTLAAFMASTVGVVLACRRPRHPVGWLLLSVGLGVALGGLIAGYLPYAVVVRPGALPAAGLLARVYAPATDLAVAALGFVLLLPRPCRRDGATGHRTAGGARAGHRHHPGLPLAPVRPLSGGQWRWW